MLQDIDFGVDEGPTGSEDEARTRVHISHKVMFLAGIELQFIPYATQADMINWPCAEPDGDQCPARWEIAPFLEPLWVWSKSPC